MKKDPRPGLVLLALVSGCVGAIDAGTRDPSAPPGADPPTSGPRAPGDTRPPGPTPTPPSASRPSAAAVKTTRLARLSHRQWENTVRDLLGLPAQTSLSAKFPTDASGIFTNNGEVLSVSESLRADYQTAAEILAQRVVTDPAALARLAPGPVTDVKARAQAFIRDFGRRAYRRLLDDQELAAFTTLFQQGAAVVPGADPFAAGVQVTIEAMLQSPHFLYRTELVTGPGRQRLGDYEIAAKLSYAIAGTMPDEALFSAAAAGGLRSLEQVSAQAERLLGTDGAPGVAFHEELFRLRTLSTEIEKDPRRFPEFKPAWRDSIMKEGALFLGEIFGRDRGLSELLTAPFTFVDATLAPLYGAKMPAGASGFVRVELDPGQRAGFLTQIGFLSRTGESESDPILRGAFINNDLLCLDLAPPPGATENISDPPATARTNRERVTAITSPAACAGCHASFVNPAGFAFEHYDALGRYRTTEGGQPVDASGSYAFASGPKRFQNAVEFSRVLAESPEVHECYARGWLSYLQGRSLRHEDEPFAKWLAARSLGERASLRSLALTVVTDDSFLTRLP
jgi:hypothetical protein